MLETLVEEGTAQCPQFGGREEGGGISVRDNVREREDSVV
jgi:hypothetical protein